MLALSWSISQNRTCRFVRNSVMCQLDFAHATRAQSLAQCIITKDTIRAARPRLVLALCSFCARIILGALSGCRSRCGVLTKSLRRHRNRARSLRGAGHTPSGGCRRRGAIWGFLCDRNVEFVAGVDDASVCGSGDVGLLCNLSETRGICYHRWPSAFVEQIVKSEPKEQVTINPRLGRVAPISSSIYCRRLLNCYTGPCRAGTLCL